MTNKKMCHDVSVLLGKLDELDGIREKKMLAIVSIENRKYFPPIKIPCQNFIFRT